MSAGGGRALHAPRAARIAPAEEVRRARSHGRGTFLVAALALGLYLVTLCPTVYFGDSGELTTVAAVFGVAHPPGYPIYTLLGSLFQRLIPIGDPAFRMNVLSAVAAATAVALTHRIALRLIDSKLAAAFPPLLVGVSRTLWSQAVIAEVYTMHLVAVAAVMLLAFRYVEKPSRGRLAALGLAAGLGLAHHLTLGPILLAALALVFSREPKLATRPKDLALAVGCTLAGLAPYAYVLARSRSSAPVRWRGAMASFGDFWHHVSGAMYQGILFAGGWSGFWWNLGRFARLALSEWGAVPLAILAPIGLAIALTRRGRRRDWLAIALVGALAVLYAANYFILDIEAYFIPAYFAGALLIGAVVDAAVAAAGRAAIPGAVALLLVLVVAATNFRENDLSSNRMARDFGEEILASLEPGSVFFGESDDDVGILMYLRYACGERPDVAVYSRFQNVLPYVEGWQDMDPRQFAVARPKAETEIAARRAPAPVYYSHRAADRFDKPFSLVPWGLVYRAVRPGEPRPEPRVEFPRWSLTGVSPDADRPRDEPSRAIVARCHERRAEALRALGRADEAMLAAASASRAGAEIYEVRKTLGDLYFEWSKDAPSANEGGSKPRLEALAAAEYEAAVGLAPAQADPRHNLGQILLLEGRTREAVSWLESAVALEGARSPASWKTHYYLALAALQMKDVDTSAAEIRRVAASADPEAKAAATELTWKWHYILAIWALEAGDLARAAAETGMIESLGDGDADAARLAQELRTRLESH